ncbi:hypothetical protein GF339_18640, partial [candidate division KSB3 bacterium]|nr:hypothetical protein [candidate division KSB3 bacterium]MBD3326609.1 hypothetical protein [candidate division KSB3 bacterium]
MAEKVLMLALSPTMETGTIAKWNVNEGDAVSSGDVLCEVETDKAVMDYETVQEGAILKILLPEGGEAGVGDPIAIIGNEGEDIQDLLAEVQQEAEQPKETPPEKAESTEPPAEKEPAAAAPEQSETPPQSSEETPGGRIKSSPLARKMAKEAGLDLQTVTGSGPGGRIVQRDIEKALSERQAPSAAAAPAAPSAAAPPLADE